MKTLRLTRAESAAYNNGERRFWRAMKPQPETRPALGMPHVHGVWMKSGWNLLNPIGVERAAKECPYGKPGDRIHIKAPGHPLGEFSDSIASVEIEQRGGKWGWVVEVGS